MRVVLDTNVLVSGLINKEGVCGRILRLVFDELLQPCVDERILEEYQTVLPRPQLQIDAEDVIGTLDLIRANGEMLAPLPLPCKLPDPGDLPFLEVAAASDAILVTGNLRHFPKKARKGVTVASPREFLDLLRRPS